VIFGEYPFALFQMDVPVFIENIENNFFTVVLNRMMRGIMMV
jgi:hypothetical protein